MSGPFLLSHSRHQRGRVFMRTSSYHFSSLSTAVNHLSSSKKRLLLPSCLITETARLLSGPAGYKKIAKVACEGNNCRWHSYVQLLFIGTRVLICGSGEFLPVVMKGKFNVPRASRCQRITRAVTPWNNVAVFPPRLLRLLRRCISRLSHRCSALTETIIPIFKFSFCCDPKYTHADSQGKRTAAPGGDTPERHDALIWIVIQHYIGVKGCLNTGTERSSSWWQYKNAPVWAGGLADRCCVMMVRCVGVWRSCWLLITQMACSP